MSLFKFYGPVKKVYRKYEQYVKFNNELVVSEFVSLFFGAVFAEIAATFSKDAAFNSGVSIAGDYIGSYTTFMAMHYANNRRKYSKSKFALLKDMLRLSPFLLIAEPTYIISRGSIHYTLMSAFGYEPYAAAVTSDLVATGILFAILNVGAKVTGFLRK